MAGQRRRSGRGPRREGDRGVTPLIGFVLLFGAALILMGVYQVTVVPSENLETEFNHHATVQSDLQEVRAAILSTGVTGDAKTISLALGTRYPSRSLFINPPPPTGTVRTVGTASATSQFAIDNAEATGDADDYWDGQSRTFHTGGLRYEPHYHEYRPAPVTAYENSVLYDRFNASTEPLSEQTVIDGERIRLVALNGSLSETRGRSYPLTVRSVSASSTAVIVRDDGDNIRLDLPTTLSRSTWIELLDGEFVANGTGGHVTAVTMTPIADSPFDRLSIELETGVAYELHLAKVGVGAGVTNVEAGFVRRVHGDNASLPVDSEQKLTAQGLDRFNNPKRAEGILFTTTDGTFSDGSTTRVVESDTEGEASVVFEPDSGGDATVEAGIDTDGDDSLADEPARLRTTFELEVRGGGGGGPGP